VGWVLEVVLEAVQEHCSQGTVHCPVVERTDHVHYLGDAVRDLFTLDDD
jgi:hypothetical protein